MITKMDFNNVIQVLKDHEEENKEYIKNNKHILNDEVIELIEIEGLSCHKMIEFLYKLMDILERI